jgi:hypothetical protein
MPMGPSDHNGIALAACAMSASLYGATSSRERFKRDSLPLPERLINDTAYDSNNLDQRLVELSIEMIAPPWQSARHHPSMAKPCAAISDAGNSEDLVASCKTLGAWSPALNTIQPPRLHSTRLYPHLALCQFFRPACTINHRVKLVTMS